MSELKNLPGFQSVLKMYNKLSKQKGIVGKVGKAIGTAEDQVLNIPKLNIKVLNIGEIRTGKRVDLTKRELIDFKEQFKPSEEKSQAIDDLKQAASELKKSILSRGKAISLKQVIANLKDEVKTGERTKEISGARG